MNVRNPLSFALLVALAAGAHAQVNVAAAANGGVASQSSVYGASYASYANDGNRSGDYGVGIAHTGYDLNAFWQDSFATATAIGTVNVFNRTDSYGERINTFDVLLFLGTTQVYASTNNTFAPTITGTNVSGMTFNVGGVRADRVRIQLDGQNYLQLGEVEAFSVAPVPEPAPFVALGLGALALLRKRRRG